MGKKAFYFNMANCIGCRTCQIACKDVNDLEVGTLFRHVDSFETGAYPSAVLYHYSSSCNHCEEPACVANCPTGAMYIDEEGRNGAARRFGVHRVQDLPGVVPLFGSAVSGGTGDCGEVQHVQAPARRGRGSCLRCPRA